MILRKFQGMVLVLFVLLMAGPATAEVITIGDNDGYGFGVPVPDNGVAIWPGPGNEGYYYDGREPAEITATNGAQFTDLYSALAPFPSPPDGPGGGNESLIGDFIFPLSQPMLSATLTVDMGDFQAGYYFAQLAVSINGIPQPDMFNFEDGFQMTRVRSFSIGAGEIAEANSAGQLILTVDRTPSADFIAFDYLMLETTTPGLEPGVDNTTAVPEPAAIVLLASGLLGLARLRRKY